MIRVSYPYSDQYVITFMDDALHAQNIGNSTRCILKSPHASYETIN